MAPLVTEKLTYFVVLKKKYWNSTFLVFKGPLL